MAEIIEGMSYEDYDKAEGFRSSYFAKLEKSPDEYKNGEDKQSAEMDFGITYHMALFQWALFLDTYTVVPEDLAKLDKRKKENKEIWDQWQKENEGKVTLSQSDMDKIVGMKEALKKYKVASNLLTNGKAEISIFWTDEETGVLCKVRIDYLREDLKIAVDLKTARDAREEAFSKAIANYSYHRQGGFYLEGIRQIYGPGWTFVFAPQEKTPSYGVHVYNLIPDEAEAGLQEARELLRIYAHCLKTDTWPGYEDKVKPIGRPKWARNKTQGGIYD